MVLACCTSFALGALATATLTKTTTAPANGPQGAAAVVRPVSFLSGLDSLPSAVEHVRVHVQAHVRAVRRKHDPKPTVPSRATISLYENTTARSVFRKQGCGAAKRGATGVVILDFGKPAYNGHTYGTILFSGAFAGNKEITHAMGAYATGYVLTRRSLPGGGAGVVEVLMTFALVWVGLPLAPALLGVCIYRLFNFWLPILPALAVLPTVKQLRRDYRRAEEELDEAAV